MAVDTEHAQYAAKTEQWSKCRDTTSGEEAVKAKKDAYLPKLKGQDNEDYLAYLTRTPFFNATSRTVEGLSGMVFRKPPIVTVPAAMEPFLEDVTLEGVSFNSFAEKTVDEVLKTGRAGVIVDFPVDVAEGPRTRADVESLKLRPFLRLYIAEDVINWRVGLVNNESVLIHVRLKETVEEPGGDEFEADMVEQIRVLDLDGGQYRQRVFRKNDITKLWEQHGDDVLPEMNGRRLDFIPFTFIGPMDTSPSVSKPPLIDLANMNLSHYRSSADMEHGAHFVGLPTPYVFGTDEAPATIGPTVVWHSSATDVVVGMLEFTGKGLEEISKLLDRKESQMAILGARMLFPEKKAVEAAETAGMHRQGENSSLASLTLAVARGLSGALEVARDWLGLTGDVEVKLNTDYFPAPMSPQMLKELIAAAQVGKISFATLHDNLQRGEIIAADKTAEDELAEIQTEAVPGMTGFDFPDTDDDETDEEEVA